MDVSNLNYIDFSSSYNYGIHQRKEDTPEKKYNRNPSVEELNAIREVDVYNNYNDWSIVVNRGESPMGNSLGDRFFYDVSDYLKDYYDGKVSKEEFLKYFDKCCDLMIEYQTYSNNECTLSNEKKGEIVGYIYSLFAYKTTTEGVNYCFDRGSELNNTYPIDINDFAYYDSEVFYKWKDLNDVLTKRAETTSVEICGNKIDTNSYLNKYPNNGFNLQWSLFFLTVNRSASMIDTEKEPPRNLKFFYKEFAHISENNQSSSDIIIWYNDNKNVSISLSKVEISEKTDDLQGFRNLGFYNKHVTNSNDGLYKFLSNIMLYSTWYSLKNMDNLKGNLLKQTI